MTLKLSAKEKVKVLESTKTLVTVKQVWDELLIAPTSTRLWQVWRRLNMQADQEHRSIEELLLTVLVGSDAKQTTEDDKPLSPAVQGLLATIPRTTIDFLHDYPDGSGHINEKVVLSNVEKDGLSMRQALCFISHSGWPFKGGITSRNPDQVVLSIYDFVCVNPQITDEMRRSDVQRALKSEPAANLIVLYVASWAAWYARNKKNITLIVNNEGAA